MQAHLWISWQTYPTVDRLDLSADKSARTGPAARSSNGVTLTVQLADHAVVPAQAPADPVVG